jgi:AmiR/NasT family two-component response regulator
MTARPPRASTKGDAKRGRPRGATQGDGAAPRLAKPRGSSVSPTDRFERITDDEVVEVSELPTLRQLRVAVLEPTSHLAPAQAAIVAAGHLAVAAVSGRDGLARLRDGLGELDAVVVALPGGEPLIDAALAHVPRRPIVIAATTAGAVEAVRRAIAAGADLVTVRPHDPERLAPILLAAARLVEQRDRGSAPLATDSTGLELAEREPAGLLPFAEFQRAVDLELARAVRHAYPLSIAMFSVEVAPGSPPVGVRGILRARAGNALLHAIRDVDVVTELERDRFLVLFPYTDRLVAAGVARRIISAVAAGDPVIAGGAVFTPRLIGAVAGTRPEAPVSFTRMVEEAAQLLEQAAVTGASLAVEP